MRPDFTPWNRDLNYAWLYKTGDTVMAEHHATQAANADTADDTEFHCDMTYLYAMRAQLLRGHND